MDVWKLTLWRGVRHNVVHVESVVVLLKVVQVARMVWTGIEAELTHRDR